MLRAFFVIAAALGCFSLLALAQPLDKKGDAGKSKDDGVKFKPKEPGKGKPPEKTGEIGKGPPKFKTPLDKVKLPKDAIVILLDDPLEAAALFGKSVTMSFEEWLTKEERIKFLERQLKPDRKVPFSCKLKGTLEGDFLIFRGAEFDFSTEAPNTIVLLGLQGGHLLDGSELDGQTPIFEHNKDDAYVVLVEKEAKRHRLTMNFRVPVQVKKSASAVLERGIEVSLPGAVVTTMSLEFSGNVKELRCNEMLEKPEAPGRWQLGLAEKSKSVTLAWKESLAPSGNAPLVKAEAQVKVDVDATHVNITGDLFLEDKRPQTKEWRLLLPKQAKVKAPADLAHEPPDDKTPYHVLRAAEATAERWQVAVALRVPRSNPLAIGPFHVLGAFQQHGTISVKMPAEASLGQRLAYARTDGIYDLTQVKNTETEAVFNFNFLAQPVTEKNWNSPAAQKAPLELSWRFEKNQLETQVDHALYAKTVSQGQEIDLATKIHVKALFAGISAIDLKLPQPHPRGMSLIGTAAPGLGFPGMVQWTGMWKTFGSPWDLANPDEFTIQDDLLRDLKSTPLDASGKVRVLLERTLAPKEVKLILKSKVRVPAPHQRLHLELPRPLGTQDRGAKLILRTDEQIEILNGPVNAEEPVPERHRFDMSWDQTPSFLDLAWRPFQREIVSQSTIDITVHEHSAEVKQTLLVPRELIAFGADGKHQVVLKVPRGIDKVAQLVGKDGKTILHVPNQQMLWLPLGVSGDQLELRYDLAITDLHLLHVTPIWPVNASQKDAKVRVWSASAAKARLTDTIVQRGLWKDRGIEFAGKDQFPVLVLQGYGADLPLSLKIEGAPTSALAAFLADRALIQVRNLEDGSQQCLGRYLLRKIHSPQVDVELPRALSHFHVRPVFKIGDKVLQAEAIDQTEKVIRLKLHPELVVLPAILEIAWTIPADGMDRNSFWRTTLPAPVFHSEVMVAEMRWQLITATPMLATSLGRNVRSEVHWSWQNWLLTPEASANSADAEAWLTDKSPAQAGETVTYAFAHLNMQSETVYHLHKRWWLLGCSGLLLVVALGGYFSPLPRLAFWLLLSGLVLAVLSLGIFAPALLPPILFGAQPGMVLVVAAIGVHWVVQERHRHRLEFLPGFRRSKQSSTMLRTNAAKRPREATTVDAPGGPEVAPAPQSNSPEA